jgi:hypothetical protein
VVIADVDCTAGGSDLCLEFNIEGYPTLKVFTDGNTKGQDYQGARDFDSLKKFVSDNLEAKCSVVSKEGCTDQEKSYMTKMAAKGSAERVKQLERLQKMAGESMKADLKLWLRQRMHILKSLEVKEDL